MKNTNPTPPLTEPAPPSSGVTGPALDAERAGLADALTRAAKLDAATDEGQSDWLASAAVAKEIDKRREWVAAADQAHAEAVARETLAASNQWALTRRPHLDARDDEVTDVIGQIAGLVDQLRSVVSRRDSTIQQTRQEAQNHLQSDLVRNDAALGVIVDGYRLVENHRRVAATVAGIIAPIIRMGDSPITAANLVGMASNVAPLWRPVDPSAEVRLGGAA